MRAKLVGILGSGKTEYNEQVGRVCLERNVRFYAEAGLSIGKNEPDIESTLLRADQRRDAGMWNLCASLGTLRRLQGVLNERVYSRIYLRDLAAEPPSRAAPRDPDSNPATAVGFCDARVLIATSIIQPVSNSCIAIAAGNLGW